MRLSAQTLGQIFFSGKMNSRDADNVTGAMIIACALATCKNMHFLPQHVKWQLNAYTNWNIIFLLVRGILSIQEWDPFLCVNSIGIFAGFRAAFCQGLDDNIRKKMVGMGLPLSRTHFVIGDHVTHTLPACFMFGLMVKHRRRVPLRTVTYAITLMSWFAFRQCGSLDTSSVYVPHPWKRSWFAAVVSMLATPALLDSIQKRTRGKTVVCILLMLLPYMFCRLDPSVRKTYEFEYICKAHTNREKITNRRSQSWPRIDGYNIDAHNASKKHTCDSHTI